MDLKIDDLADVLKEDPEGKIFQLRRRIFTDPKIFDREMERIFEANWVYLAHESQLPEANSFLTTTIGRKPVILSRARDGGYRAVVNACAHRGAKVEVLKAGRKSRFVCPFHAWSYRPDGTLLSCAETGQNGYGGAFEKGKNGLRPVALVQDYRGFIFGSLTEDVLPLAEHLGDVSRLIDLIVDQDPDGKIEVLPGVHTFTYEGNWKIALENGSDGFHVPAVHANYVRTVANRLKTNSARGDVVEPIDVSNIVKKASGFFSLANGHHMQWYEAPNPEVRPVWRSRGKLAERYGEEQAAWMADRFKFVLLYPNMYLMDQMSTQFRVITPLAVDKTLVTTYCFGPKSDSDADRGQRLRLYEDFFNASGLATSDDISAYLAMQRGLSSEARDWSDISRHSKETNPIAERQGRELGITPLRTGTSAEDERVYLNVYKTWFTQMTPSAIAPGGANA